MSGCGQVPTRRAPRTGSCIRLIFHQVARPIPDALSYDAVIAGIVLPRGIDLTTVAAPSS
ncbi:hypothetical protein GCM10027408_36510 [Microbacterium tumbae]